MLEGWIRWIAGVMCEEPWLYGYGWVDESSFQDSPRRGSLAEEVSDSNVMDSGVWLLRTLFHVIIIRLE